MTESSGFWDGTTLGDAAGSAFNAPYSSSEYAEFLRDNFGPHNVSPNPRFYIPVSAFGYSNLQVTGTATPVVVAAGNALVAGFTYINDANINVAVSTPGANPRIDRVVLRISWAAQTIRVALLAGTEAATPSPPALTQTIGTTYEVSLAQIYITTGGVITVRDERPGFMGLGPGVFFRDIRDRMLEEFADNFYGDINWGTNWNRTLVGTGAATVNAGPPSAVNITTGATNTGSALIVKGATVAGFFATELQQAPILFEARMQIATAVDANGVILMRLVDTAATSYIEFGMRGSVSTANLMVRNAAGGAATSFTTGQAVDTAAYHTYGIYVPASTGPAVVVYDGVPIGQMPTTPPAAGTDLRAEFRVENGATNAARTANIDWARLNRGIA